MGILLYKVCVNFLFLLSIVIHNQFKLLILYRKLDGREVTPRIRHREVQGSNPMIEIFFLIFWSVFFVCVGGGYLLFLFGTSIFVRLFACFCF